MVAQFHPQGLQEDEGSGLLTRFVSKKMYTTRDHFVIGKNIGRGRRGGGRSMSRTDIKICRKSGGYSCGREHSALCVCRGGWECGR